jgi:predicted nuclease of predicted toxin-antitoxin system
MVAASSGAMLATTGDLNSLVVWIDAQLPPAMTRWLAEVPGVTAHHTSDLGLLGARDSAIWDAARAAGAVIITKDTDFVERVERLGPPPQIVWVTIGNVSNHSLQALVRSAWPRAVILL